ncbi:hypothetical protein [Paenibacillus sp. MBLB4367]|uniref:hypothetical protein n=1 Tax=Paenibacillus sp. MBLB4367 TaxID=3384767 RepID=UPI00390834AF
MANFWLTPVTNDDKLIVRAERLLCAPLFELNAFRERLSAVHARLLLLFKANLLPGDDDEDACGTEDAFIPLDGGLDIAFDGDPLELSHCAQAFFDRLPSARECLQWLEQCPGVGDGAAVNRNDAGWSPIQLEWLKAMIAWLQSGYQVILLREE